MAESEELFQSGEESNSAEDFLFDEDFGEEELFEQAEADEAFLEEAPEEDAQPVLIEEESGEVAQPPAAEAAAASETVWPYGTKRKLFLTSLVAAIPAAVLAVVMIHAFLSYTEKMNAKLMAVAALTLLTAAVTALMPVGIWVFSPKEAEPEETPSPTEEQEEESEESQEEAKQRDEGFGDVIPEDFDPNEVQAVTEEQEDELEVFDLDQPSNTDEFEFDEDVFKEE